MSGGGSRSHRPSAAKGLAEGAGRINTLTPNDNFGDRPHQTAHTGRTKVGTADRATLSCLSEREARVADAAARLAYEHAADWLSTKEGKARAFPGGDLVHAQGRAAAYQNAAQELYGWATRHGEE